MKKIITPHEAAQISRELKEKSQKIILVGGCFDVLHPGHIRFLEESRKNADKLFLLLESDENIKKYKGDDRPINSQTIRAKILSALSHVDYIIALSGMTKNEDYDKLIVQIQPDFISLTKGDKNTNRRREQCNLVNAKFIEIEKLEGFSSSNYINNINQNG